MENRGYLSDGVYVNCEYAPEIERKRCTMLPVLQAARLIEGYKKQVQLDKDKMVIKGKDYDMSNIHDLPEDLNAFKVTSKESDDVIGYFGELNPLSNFFPGTFSLDGYNYISSEQYIQASKAQYFGDTEVFNQIMGCKCSIDCKDFSRKIRGVDNSKWDTVAADICHSGIREKFVQNPILMEILVKRTGNKRIVECAKDRLWGTGVPLAQEDCLNSDRWITPGIMGKLLEDIRMEFSTQYSHALSGNSLMLLGVCPDPVSASIGTDPTTQQHEPTLHPLLGIQANSVPIANPSELHPSMFSSSNPCPRVSGILMETNSSPAEAVERQEDQPPEESVFSS